jgi:Amidohydrolase
MLSRRDVLTTTVAAGAGLAMAAQAYEPAKSQLAGRIIVDAQVHIWLANTPERPWPADGIGQAHIPRPFSYYELLARMDEAGVDRVVIVPPSWEGYHNEYAMEAAKKWPHRFAVMGRLRLDDPKSKELLATWKDQPGMLGVRHTFNRLQSAWLTDGTADWFWPAAAKAGIPVMTSTASAISGFVLAVRCSAGTPARFKRPRSLVQLSGKGAAPLSPVPRLSQASVILRWSPN